MKLAVQVATAALLGFGIMASASAADGVVSFSGSIMAPTCSAQVQGVSGSVALQMICEDAAVVTRKVSATAPAKSLNNYVAAVSMQPVGRQQSIMTVEYR
ncbi:hypothetical protein C2I19_02175 [Chromobacterium alticapitis]|uniref:Type 1 fimbrial protein n=2 Tax=Chromobacterium alticapitis TaxID=2073169 RepID=A0A2S5DKX8_9NEIS|nr:hypothetical protein C2I19_02175 [Chromobacterium alticapitis]